MAQEGKRSARTAVWCSLLVRSTEPRTTTIMRIPMLLSLKWLKQAWNRVSMTTSVRGKSATILEYFFQVCVCVCWHHFILSIAWRSASLTDSDHGVTSIKVNMANLAGVLWYLHSEVVGHCPRKFGITRVLRLLAVQCGLEGCFLEGPWVMSENCQKWM